MSSIEFDNLCSLPSAASPQRESADNYQQSLFRVQRRFQTIDNLDTIATSSSQESKITAQLGGFQPTQIQLRKAGNLNSRPELES